MAQETDSLRAYREKILPQKIGIYCEYVANQSLAADLRILLQTLLIIARRK